MSNVLSVDSFVSSGLLSLKVLSILQDQGALGWMGAVCVQPSLKLTTDSQLEGDFLRVSLMFAYLFSMFLLRCTRTHNWV